MAGPVPGTSSSSGGGRQSASASFDKTLALRASRFFVWGFTPSVSA